MAATCRLVVPWMRVSAQRVFPVVQVGLSLLQAFETQPFQRSILGMADAAFHFSLGSSRQLHPVVAVRGNISG